MGSARRQPSQLRSRQTVEAILDAVLRILKREGPEAVTTNRIAEVAGVSIGSLYQYFPDKRAIFAALHSRHVSEIDQVVQTALIAHAGSSLEDLVRALVDAMIDAHSGDPELYQLLMTQVPQRPGGSKDFASRLHNTFRLAIASTSSNRDLQCDPDTAAFIVANMVDSLCHAAILRRPPTLTLEAARDEAVAAVMAYLERRTSPGVHRLWDS
jgi:AcrR family transcriptional regulator